MGILDGLAACAGSWRGTNTLQDPGTDRPEGSRSTLDVTPLLGGRFVRLDYTWAYQGEPQEGSMLLGYDPHAAELSGHWIDTWHLRHRAMVLRGEASPGGPLSVTGSYSAPSGPDWGWRIAIAREGDALRISHTNIAPGGKDEPAVEALYSRSWSEAVPEPRPGGTPRG